MEKVIFKETFYSKSPDRSSGFRVVDLVQHLLNIEEAVSKGANILNLEWSASCLDISCTRKLSEEEVLKEKIKELTEKLEKAKMELANQQKNKI